jgi:hypothetical protein
MGNPLRVLDVETPSWGKTHCHNHNPTKEVSRTDYKPKHSEMDPTISIYSLNNYTKN